MKSSDLPPTEHNPFGDKFLLAIFENQPNGDVNDTQQGITLSDAEWTSLKYDAAARGESVSDWLQRVFADSLPKSDKTRRKPRIEGKSFWDALQRMAQELAGRELDDCAIRLKQALAQIEQRELNGYRFQHSCMHFCPLRQPGNN